MRRTIIIGDVHGCYAELQDLLRKVDSSQKDRLISVGDLIAKGPDSAAVLDWALRTPNLECVLGNHELRLLDCWRRGRLPDEKPYDAELVGQLGRGFDGYMRRIARWPMVIAGREFLVVHGGFVPGTPPARQDPRLLANLRRLPGTDLPWYDAYRGKRLAVFGHWARKRPVVRDNAIGLDTGCVYGVRLTALVLPQRRLVSVPARRVYRRKQRWG